MSRNRVRQPIGFGPITFAPCACCYGWRVIYGAVVSVRLWLNEEGLLEVVRDMIS